MIRLDADIRNALAEICAEHLREEERALRVAVPMARAVQQAFLQPRVDALMDSLRSQQAFTQLLETLQDRRRQLRTQIALRLTPGDAKLAQRSLSGIIELLPLDAQDCLLSQLASVRQLAEELVRLNHWLAVHTRIHLDAYENILRDLVGSAAPSGRYGPQGKADAPDYRPLLEVHG